MLVLHRRRSGQRGAGAAWLAGAARQLHRAHRYEHCGLVSALLLPWSVGMAYVVLAVICRDLLGSQV